MSLDDGSRRTFYGRTRREVQLKLKQALQARDAGQTVTSSERTVAEYLDQWLENVAKPSIRPMTYESYALNVRRLRSLVGHVRLSELSPAAIQAAYGTLLRSGLAPRTVIKAHAVLHRALRQAVHWGLLVRNPVDGVSRPKTRRPEIRTLTQEELRNLFESTADHRLHALWVVLGTTGMRVGEALGLMWSDVDLESGRLGIRRSLQRQKGIGYTLVDPKTDKSRRSVYLAPGAVRALIEHRERQAEERRTAGPTWDAPHDLVFKTQRGRPMGDGMVNWRFHKALREAGLPQIRVHDLRHTAATQLLEKGVHPKIVQELLGHSTIMLTLDTYSHVAPALHAEVAERMQELFARDDSRAR